MACEQELAELEAALLPIGPHSADVDRILQSMMQLNMELDQAIAVLNSDFQNVQAKQRAYDDCVRLHGIPDPMPQMFRTAEYEGLRVRDVMRLQHICGTIGNDIHHACDVLTDAKERKAKK